jgi:hypothetical protein
VGRPSAQSSTTAPATSRARPTGARVVSRTKKATTGIRRGAAARKVVSRRGGASRKAA